MNKVYLSLIGLLLLGGGFWLGTTTLSKSDEPKDAEIVQRLEEDLSSVEGLMRLVPELRNSNGDFEIPNPTVDLQKFLNIRQSLLTIIEMSVTKANILKNPYTFSKNPHSPLKLSSNWNAHEVGFATDASTIPDFSNGGFGYVGKSFMNGIIAVKGTNDSFYTIPESAVYMSLMPTSLACVNRIMETSGLNGGTMMAVSYVLGGKNGEAYLIVNGCQNPAKTIIIENQQVLAPAASSYLGMQSAEQ